MVERASRGTQQVLPDTPEFPNRFFCKLFDDMIVRHTCLLRRSELNGTVQFSCQGCSKDRLLTAVLRRREMFAVR